MTDQETNPEVSPQGETTPAATEPATEDTTPAGPATEPATEDTTPANVSRETSDEDPDDHDDGDDLDDDEPETVTGQLSKVRKEAAKYRRRLRDTESRLADVQAQLFTARVRETGRLADPTDMPVDPQLLDDPEALAGAIDSLLEAKPHLKARAFGDVRQGDRDSRPAVSLGTLLRQNA